jgi:hypothetical protein
VPRELPAHAGHEIESEHPEVASGAERPVSAGEQAHEPVRETYELSLVVPAPFCVAFENVTFSYRLA